MIESHQDTLVITAKVDTNTLEKILIDNGNSVDILYHSAYSRMDLGDRKMENVNIPRYSFTRNEVKIIGTIDLPVLFGTSPYQMWHVKFHVTKVISSYNAILDRTMLTALKTITSIPYLKIKFSTDFGIGEVVGDQVTVRQCYLSTILPKQRHVDNPFVNQVLEIDLKDTLEVPTESTSVPMEETEKIKVEVWNSKRVTKIGKGLQGHARKEIIDLIREFSDIFAWDPTKMPGIPEVIARQSLHIDPRVRPVRQNKRIFSEEKRQVINAKLDKLLAVGFIDPV